MKWMLDIELKKLEPPIGYEDKMMLVGSCFTEHIGNALENLKFSTLQNPNGILFGPDAVCKSLLSYIHQKTYTADDLFMFQESWHSWDHHSRFSRPGAGETVAAINASQSKAHAFLQSADWLIITLGSSFMYRLSAGADTASLKPGDTVANCHRAPAAWFSKELLETDAIKEMLQQCLQELKAFNQELKFIFTISPVRHIRDGVVENNRSKARLIEAVHFITTKFESAYYFPAYELVIDVLRDYRFYDIDLVHPNYPATDYVMEKFTETCIAEEAHPLMEEVRKLVIAARHKPFQPESNSHRQFLKAQYEKAMQLKEKYPFLELELEMNYFNRQIR